MDLSLEDFFVEYPSIQEPELQYLIGSKKEFYDLKLDRREPTPDKGEFFKSQLIVHRYLRAYDELLIIHSTGTGKTRSVSGLAEYYKHNRSFINHVYVLVKGGTLLKEIKRDILCAYPEDYNNSKIRKAPSNKARLKNITTSLGKWYTIKTQKIFAFKIRKNYWHKSDEDVAFIEKEKIKESKKTKKKKSKRGLLWHMGQPDLVALERDFSGSIFWIDEAHSLRVNPDIDYREKTGKLSEKEIVYQTLDVLFHTIKRSKKILTTATPMINSPSDIKPLINLLLPYDERMPEKIDFDTITLEEITPYFKGRVSYLRAFETGAIPQYIGDHIYDLKPDDPVEYQTKVYPTEMNELQNGGYAKSGGYKYTKDLEANKAKMFEDNNTETSSHGIYTPEMQASNFVYPDGSFGPEGFKKYVKGTKGKYSIDESFRSLIDTPEKIANYSCKYADICDRLRLEGSDPETGVPNNGNFFIYSEYLEGSGLIVLSMCLEAMGYTQFLETGEIFSKAGEDQDYCASRNDTGLERDSKIAKAPRYAIISKDTASRIPTILNTMNAYENRHGDYIKVLLSSPMGSEGINISNILNIEIIDSEWNPAKTFQALSRGIRATSHIDLLKEKAIELDKPIGEVFIDIDIRLHCAAPSSGDLSSINIDMYEISERKDRRIKRVERFLKQIAIDCWLNHLRNVRPGDTPGSIQCDYQQCNYVCINRDPDLELFDDRSTFDLLYADHYLEIIGKDLTRFMTSEFTATLKQLHVRYKNYESKYIDMALDRLIRAKIQVLDRFGFVCYIQEESGTIYLSREYPVRNKERFQNMYPLLTYSSSLIASSNSNVRDLVSSLAKVSETEKLIDISEEDPNFDAKIDALDNSIKRDLLEQAIVNEANGVETNRDIYISEKYKFWVHKTTVPKAEILRTQKEMSEKVTKGKKAQKQVIRRPNKLIQEKERLRSMAESEGNEDEIYISMFDLYISIITRTSQTSVTSDLNSVNTKLRLFRPGVDDAFRTIENPYEAKVYSTIMQNYVADEMGPYEEKGVFGSLIGGRFRMHDINKESATSVKDNRSRTRGKICSTGRKEEIIGYMLDLGVEPPVSKKTYEQLYQAHSGKLKINLAEMEEENALFYLRWIDTRKSKDALCAVLFDFLEQNEGLFVPQE